jgi:cytochrome b561
MRGNRASPSAVRRLLAALHELGAKVAMALIALHIAAAALQGRLLRDGVLQRMLPRRGR